LKRVLPFFYFEGDYAKNLGAWLPSLSSRLRRGVVAPVAVVTVPLFAAFVLTLPLSLPALVWIAAWGVMAGLGAMYVMDSLAIEPITHLKEALNRFGHGDLQALLDVTSGDEIGHATETYNKTLRAVDKRFFVLENFGHAVAPGKSEALFEGGLRLDGEKRAVALMEVAWHNAGASTKSLEAPLQLSTLNRFYEAVQDAVEKAQGGVLHLGEGRVLAIWGAPLADESAVQGALAAAWSLQATLKVWANQQRLRGGEEPKWGLGVSTGQATVGLVGPKNKQRYSVLGGPADEVQGLAQRVGGPWLDERSAAAAKAPFAVQIAQSGPQLIAGSEPEAPSAEALGFTPGSKL
jgi:HAMP domain-containing protein